MAVRLKVRAFFSPGVSYLIEEFEHIADHSGMLARSATIAYRMNSTGERTMQDPPQQPPDPPSEVYMPEQPQVYTPQPPMATQAIAIHANRRLLALRTAFVVISLLVIGSAIPVFAIFSVLSGVPLGMSDLAPLFLIVIPGTALVGWMSWTMLSILLAHKPMLLINREGIVVSSMPLLSGFSISWGEIEAIFPSRYSRYKFLCIVPKNPDHYLKTHFNGFGRFYRQSNSRVGSPLYIPQINLAKQVEEILQQVSHTYASEVSYYHVQVRSYSQDVLS
jgi:hypothetical protein